MLGKPPKLGNLGIPKVKPTMLGNLGIPKVKPTMLGNQAYKVRQPNYSSLN